MKKLSVNSPEYRELVTKLLGKEVKFEASPAIPIPTSPKTLPVPSRSPPKPIVKKSAPKQAKKAVQKNISKYYITESTFNKISEKFSDKFDREFDWRSAIEFIQIRIVNMYVIREVSLDIKAVLRNESDFSEDEVEFIEDAMMDIDYGNAVKDIKNGNLEKVSSDLVLGFFDPNILHIFKDNNIKILVPLYTEGKNKVYMSELKPGTYLSPILSDDT